MKKVISLLLALVLCLSLCACGKSEAVKNVEAMIDSLAEINENSGTEINEINIAYNALTEKEQKKVKNFDTFAKLRDAYYMLALIGTWYPFALSLYEPEHIFSPRYSIILNEDMTFVDVAYEGGNTSGNWEVRDGNLILLGINGLSTETSASFSMENDYVSLPINYSNGRVFFYDASTNYYNESTYYDALEEVVIAIDCANVNLNDYFGFISYEVQILDEWGTHTGEKRNRVCLQNLLYDDGWMYLGTNNEFLLEVLYPDYTETYSYTNGETHVNECNAGGYTLMGCPYNIGGLSINWSTKDATVETGLTLDSLSLGRAKGMVYLINSKYVKEVRKDEYGGRVLVLDMNQENYFLGVDMVHQGIWEEENQAY